MSVVLGTKITPEGLDEAAAITLTDTCELTDELVRIDDPPKRAPSPT